MASIIESAVIVVFLLLFNGGRRRKWLSYLGGVIASLLLSVNVILTTYDKIFSKYTFLIDIFILLFFSISILNLCWHQIILSIILCYIFLIAGNIISIGIIYLGLHIELTRFIGGNGLYAFLCLFISKILWGTILGFILYVKKSYDDQYIGLSETITISLAGLLTILSTTGVFIAMTEHNIYLSKEEILLLGVIVILDFIVCWLLLVITAQKNKAREFQYLKKSIVDQEAAYGVLLNNLDELRKQRHNVENVLIALNVLLEKHEYDSLNIALKEMMGEISDHRIANIAGENNMWFAVIEYKKQVATQKSIKFMTEIAYGDYSWVRGVDFCIICGNLLDNAIEAAEKQYKRKEIHMTVKNDFGIIYIQVKNYLDQEDFLIESLSRSSKTDFKLHGYGLKTVREIVTSYKGTIKIYFKDHYFYVEIMLFFSQKRGDISQI